MLHVFLGTDTEMVRGALQKKIAHIARNADIVRITDAHSPNDIHAALMGGGMFGGERVIIFEHVLTNEEAGEVLMRSLESLKDAHEHFFIVEDKMLAPVKKKFEKYVEKIESYDLPKGARDNAVFSLANALERGDKKALWIGYLRELAKGSAPEMVHGVLFWAAKQQALRALSNRTRAHTLVAVLSELPHMARRQGFDMEYALERFVLSEV